MPIWLQRSSVDHCLTIMKSDQTHLKILKKNPTTLESIVISIRTVGSLKKSRRKIQSQFVSIWLQRSFVDHCLTIMKSDQTHLRILKKNLTTLESIGIRIRAVGSLKRVVEKIESSQFVPIWLQGSSVDHCLTIMKSDHDTSEIFEEKSNNT